VLLLTRLPMRNPSIPEWISRLFPTSRRTLAFQQLIDGANEFMTCGTQFANPMLRHLLQHALSAWQERHQHAPPVVPAPGAPHVSVGFEPVDQFHHAVVLQRQTLRQRPDRGFFVFREPPDGQQQQILLRFQTRSARHGVALTDEVPDSIAQLRQGAVFLSGNLCRHECSIS
jgi:hypothetical protein